jgi:hypothetical protein
MFGPFAKGLIAFFAHTDSGSGSSAWLPKGGEEAQQPCNDGNGGCVPVRCCCLACADVECPFEGNPANFACPPGSFKTYWTCVEMSQTVGCGECASGPSCFDAPWFCSIAFDIN